MSVILRVKQSGMLYLDIHYNGGRTKPSMGLKDTKKNRKVINDIVIPNIELEIQKGTFVPKAQRIKQSYTVEEYGYFSLERNKDLRREHINRAMLNHFKNHIVPEFGKRLLSSISSMQLLDWQIKKLETYAESTVKKFRSIFNTILQDAVTEDVIDKNPFEKVRHPKKTGKNDFNFDNNKVNPFTLEEINLLINKANGYLKFFIAIMAFSGVRPGELVALKWEDVDFENEIFHINKTRIKNQDGPVKTKSSLRTVEMIGSVKEYFLNQYKLTGDNQSGYVFLNASKKLFHNHDTIGSQFKKLLDKNDKRYLYQLRHTFASVMISEGEDMIWVSQMMGHKDLDITLKVYTHFYNLSKDKKSRKKRALFLEKRL